MDAATIRIAMEVDGAGVASGLKAGSAGFAAFGASAVNAFNLAGNSATSFATKSTLALKNVQTGFAGLSAGTKVLGKIGLGVGALALGLSQVISPAIAFESAFAGVLKTVDGTTLQLAGIRDGLIDLSTIMPTSAADLASIAENAGQLGVEAGNVLEFTKVIAQLGETTDLSFDEAAQSLARFLNITGTGAGNITKVADVIVDLGNNSATTESQIVGFATRLASAFTVAGATEAQILGIAAAFSSLGVMAEAGGSSLSKIITGISDAAKDGGHELDVYASTAGILPETFREIAAANPVEALLLFGEGLGKVNEAGGSLTPIFKAIGIEGLRTNEIYRLLGLNFDLVRASIGRATLAYVEGGAAQLEYNKRAETTASRLAILGNQIVAVAIAAGTPFLDGIADGADAAAAGIKRLSEIFGPLASVIATTFGNGAGLVDQFFETVGGPGASGATDVLALFVDQVTGLILALNALAVDATNVGPATIVAGAGIAAMGVASGTAATGLAAASAGALSFVAGLNPIVVAAVGVGAALVLLAGQMGKVKGEAEATTDALTGGFAAALNEGNYTSFSNQLGVAEKALAGLRSELDDASAVDKFNQFLSDLSPLLFGASGDTELLTAKIAALEAELDTEQIDRFKSRVELLASQFGLTAGQVTETTDALGISNLLVEGSLESWQLLQAGLRGATDATSQYGDELDVLTLSFVNGTATAASFLDHLGVTTGELQALADLLPGVGLEVEDLFSDVAAEKSAAFAAAADLVNITVQAMADAIGITNTAFREQIDLLSRVEGAFSNAQDAMNGVADQLNAVWEQEQLVADAAASVVTALDGIVAASDLTAAAESQRDYQLQLAASGVSVASLEASQRLFEAALRDTAKEAGIYGPAVEKAIAQSRIPDAQLELVRSQGVIWSEQANQIRAALGDIELGLDDAIGVAELWAGEWRADFEAGGVKEAGAAVEETTKKAIEWAIPWEANVYETGSAEAQSSVESATGSAIEWAIPWEANVYEVGAPEAQSEVESATGSATSWAVPWEANIFESGAAGAQSSVESATGAAGDWAGIWQANIVEIGAANSQTKVESASSAARTYDGAYNAILTAQVDSAVTNIGRAVSALGGFTSKTITLATNTVNSVTNTVRNIFGGSSGGTTTSGSGGGGNLRRQADGGIIAAFANGGSTIGMPQGAVQSSPGRAQIYTPVTPGRFFSEPETGGEAYIPLHIAKRKTAIPVWAETGKILGVLANGGIQSGQSTSYANGGIRASTSSLPAGSPIVLNAPVTVEVDARGHDETRIPDLVAAGVQQGLTDAAYELRNVLR